MSEKERFMAGSLHDPWCHKLLGEDGTECDCECGANSLTMIDPEGLFVWNGHLFYPEGETVHGSASNITAET